MSQTVPLSIIRSFSLYTQQWYMSYRFADSWRAGLGRFRHDARSPERQIRGIICADQSQNSIFYYLYICSLFKDAVRKNRFDSTGRQ